MTEKTKTFQERLLAAQKECKHPVKNKTNPHYKNQYADLTSVIDAVIPVFNKHGLTVTQGVHGRSLTTIVQGDPEGYALRFDSELPEYTTAQQMGSALTYLRRYTLQALAGVSAEDDDDGNIATPPKTKPAPSGKAKGTKKKETAETPAEDNEEW